MKEFAAVSKVIGGNEDEFLLFKLDDEAVTISAPIELAEEIKYWAGYFSDDEMWPKHLKEKSPLSSLFRGSYINLEYGQMDEAGTEEYNARMAEMKKSGQVRTRVVPLP